MTIKEYYTTKELSECWNVPVATLKGWRTKRSKIKGPAFVIFGKRTVRYHIDEIKQYEFERACGVIK